MTTWKTAHEKTKEWAKPEKRDAAVCNKTFNKQLAKLDAFPEKFAGSSKACCESAPAGTSIQNTKETVNEQRSKEDKQPTRVKQESRLPTAPSNNLCQLAFGAKGVYISLNQPPIHDALGTVSRAQKPGEDDYDEEDDSMMSCFFKD